MIVVDIIMLELMMVPLLSLEIVVSGGEYQGGR